MDQITYKISWAPLARENKNGIITAHEIKRKQATAGGRPKPSTADSTYRNSENTSSFVSGFQPECKYKKSVRAFTAVRGGPFVEELTLEISNKLLSSEIRERDSWLLKLSLDFLNINEWCIVQKTLKIMSFICHTVYTNLSFINQCFPCQCLHTGKRNWNNWINPSLRPKKVPSHKVRTFKFCDECTALKNREDSKDIFTIIV